MTRYFWTTPELAIIREHYPTGGVPACAERLPGRTVGAIHQQARKMGLFAPKGGTPRPAYGSSEFIDAQICRVYTGKPTKGAIRDLAKRIGRPRHWVSRRAAALGMALPRFRDQPWSEQELAILENATHLRPEAIRARLKKAGFTRTINAITVKRKRLGLRLDREEVSANELAVLMGVDRKTVSYWIDKGWLRAKKRGPIFDIRPSDVRDFVIDFTHVVDIRKCDKFWLVDLLAGTNRPKGRVMQEAV
jgi:hypothetical protein